MTGPEHYKAAEGALALADGADLGSDEERYLLAEAQVHATLALAAATAQGNVRQAENNGGLLDQAADDVVLAWAQVIA